MAEAQKPPEDLKIGALRDVIYKQHATENAHQTVSSEQTRRQGRPVTTNKPRAQTAAHPLGVKVVGEITRRNYYSHTRAGRERAEQGMYDYRR